MKSNEWSSQSNLPTGEAQIAPRHARSERHPPALARFFSVWSFLAVGGCATLTTDQPFPAREALIGKTEKEVVVCAGEPLARTSGEEGAVLIYYREAPPLERSFVGSKASVPIVPHGCRARLKLKDQRVTEVEYVPVPASIGGMEHCEQMFEPCLQR